MQVDWYQPSSSGVGGLPGSRGYADNDFSYDAPPPSSAGAYGTFEDEEPLLQGTALAGDSKTCILLGLSLMQTPIYEQPVAYSQKQTTLILPWQEVMSKSCGNDTHQESHC